MKLRKTYFVMSTFAILRMMIKMLNRLVNVRNALITIKCYINKYRIYFWPVAVVIIFSISIARFSSEGLKILNGKHFDILSTNAMLAGFLFTGIGIMISVNDKPFIKELKKAGYWSEMYKTTFLGITCNFISIGISLIGMISLNLPPYIIFFELLFLTLGLTFFVLTISSLKDTLYLL